MALHYDADCKAMHRRFHDALRLAPSPATTHLLRQLRKEYRALCRTKKNAHHIAEVSSLLSAAKRCPAAFWRHYRKAKACIRITDLQQWYSYCSQLYAPCRRPTPPPQPATQLPASVLQQRRAAAAQLDEAITADEVAACLKRLRRGKAAGIDGLLSECILDAAAQLTGPLTTLFNKMFSGPFPQALNSQLVHPIYKEKGDPLDPSNYRPISVGPVLAKLYAMVLEARIATWAETCGARAIAKPVSAANTAPQTTSSPSPLLSPSPAHRNSPSLPAS